MTVVIGVDPHKRTHTAVVIDHDEIPLATLQVRAPAGRSSRSCWLGRPASMIGCGRSSPRTGSAICLASSSSVPVSGCWTCPRRCRRGCGCWRRHVEQERSERCVVGRDRCPSRAARQRGSGCGSSGGAAAAGEAPQRSGPVAEPDCVSASRTAVRARRRVESARKSRRIRRNGCSKRSRRPLRSSAPATSSPSISRGPAAPRHAAPRVATTCRGGRHRVGDLTDATSSGSGRSSPP